MKYCSLCLLCLLMFGCSKGSNQASSPGSPSGPPKKDPAIDAAVYAFQSIDYVENACVEKSCPIDEVNELDDDLIKPAVDRIPAADTNLHEVLTNFRLLLVDLSTAKEVKLMYNKEDYEYKLGAYHRERDQVLEKIKNMAAQQNAIVELKPVDELEVAHPPDPKWKRNYYDDHGQKTVYYQLRAKNAIIAEDPFDQTDKPAKPILDISCRRDGMLISVGTSVQKENVRLKFDAAPLVNETWLASNNSIQTLHAPQLFARLSKTKVFSVELMPKHRNPQTVIYNLSDFKTSVGEDWDCKH